MNETPVKFYGKRVLPSRWETKLSRAEKHFKENPIPKKYKNRIDGPSREWRVFRRQEDAFQFARTKSVDLQVYSFESEMFFDRHGRRAFLVATNQHFWHYYSQLKTGQRNHYELIPEGAVCHLYFDLEFYRQFNPNRSGSHMTQVFIKRVCLQLKLQYDIVCSSHEVLQLDASTDAKFSRHLVFHLPGAAFKDNYHACNFVRSILRKLPDKCGLDSTLSTVEATETHDEQHPELTLDTTQRDEGDLEESLVKTKNGQTTTFCDTAVYTKNRNFRLYLSCKLGKNNPLLVADDNQYMPVVADGDGKTREQRLFMDSLITAVRYTDNLRILTCDKDDTTIKRGANNGRASSKVSGTSIQGYHHSPHPDIDCFIEGMICRGGVQGYIRRWSYFSQGALLVYDIAKNRWCERIGRPHKNNNIMLLVDLRAGIYYQRCHDPDCRALNFRSTDCPLPKHLLRVARGEKESDGEVDDEELLRAAAQLEGSQIEGSEIETLQGVHSEDIDWLEATDDELLLAATAIDQVVNG